MTMSQSAYPHSFTCEECGNELTVTREGLFACGQCKRVWKTVASAEGVVAVIEPTDDEKRSVGEF